MLAMLHPPSRAYIDPWTGQLFGEGGVEKTWHPSKLPGKDNSPMPVAGVGGGVIMSKLGNETAKYVHVIGAAEMVLTETEQRWVELHGNYCKFGIMS